MNRTKKYILVFTLLIIYITAIFFCCLYNFSGSTGMDLGQYFWGIRLDRVFHFLMFFPYSFICWTLIKSSLNRTFFVRHITVTVVASGIVVATFAELSQELLTTYRDSDPWDLVANVSAIVTGIIIIMIMNIFRKNKKNLIESGVLDGMTDTHSHLLFGVDDGARSAEHSAEIIRRLTMYGIRRSFATPHIMSGGSINHDVTIPLQFLVDNHKFNIRLAAEYMLDERFLERLHGESRLLTYDGKHILVEMSHLSPPINLNEILYEIENCGYTPVIAHPERYCSYFVLEDYRRLKERGCLFQLNILSFTDVYGKRVNKCCCELLEKGFYDFIGTDAHSSNGVKMIETITLTPKQTEQVAQLVKNNELLWL